MDVTPEGILTETSLLQPENASFPMDVTLAGMLTEARPLR
jgi:hypothetical protein